jgi:hypothetical protein
MKNVYLFGDALRNAPTSGWRFFGQHIMGIEDPLKNTQIVSKTLWETVSE